MADVNFVDPKTVPEEKSPEFIVLKFSDSKVPVFKETRNKEYIKYGENNLYPEYLTYLFNKSAKHNAIINGKSHYVFGNGYENGDFIINRCGDSLNDVSKKSVTDIELYAGYRWEIIWGHNKKIAEIYHVEFQTLRKAKNGGFYYKETWNEREKKCEEEFIPAFDPTNPVGSQIFEYNEYRPGVRYYPLPGYIGSNNYIETDIEISKYYLSSIRNGMLPSKMIQFFSGEPTEEKKRQIEKRWNDKFTGSENAGKVLLVFNAANAQNPVQVDDLSASELDKHFQELNKTTQQEIYAGHNVTSPMLFGIKTEGQLGGNNELQVAYSIFQNTYSKPKAKAYDKEVNWILGYSNFPGKYELKPSEPIGLNFDVKDVIGQLPKQFILEKLGVPQDMWNMPAADGKVIEQASSVNDTIKNLTGRQHQAIERIVRKYENGKMTRAAAVTMLKKGYALDDEDIDAFLGPDETQQFSAEDVISVFDEFGESKSDFEIVKSKKVCFETDEEAEADEVIFINEAFKTYDISSTENRIIELIKKDERITPDVIASTIGETKAFVERKIDSLIKRGYIETSKEVIGLDEIIKRTVPKGIDIITPPPKTKINPTQIYIKYSYEGPVDNRNRPFCAKLMSLNRLYSRAEIEKISQRLGYSVFDRRGGFWNDNGVIKEHCRHSWKSNIVIKKGGENVS
ncbi:MAG: hypothetical protein QM791_04080 [Ferruginibacter sp.]